MKLNFKISPRDVNFLGFLTIKSLFDYLIEAATTHAIELGFGLKELNDRGYSWVLSGVAVDIVRMAKIREHIVIETWIERSNRIYSYRHFQITTPEGEILMKATSLWSIIDIKERKLANLTKVVDFKEAATGKKIDVELSERLLEITPTSSSSRCVVYSDIDINGHANSSRYIEWMCDALENVFERINSLKRFEIYYLQEVLFGEKIDILAQNDPQNKREIFLLKREDSHVACSAIFSF